MYLDRTFKNLLFTVLCISASHLAYAQSPAKSNLGDKTSNFTVFSSLVRIVECDIEGNDIKPRKELFAPLGYTFHVVDATDTTQIVSFWKWPENDSINKIYFYKDITKMNKESEDNIKFFHVRKRYFDDTKIRPRFSNRVHIGVGAVSVPLRIRFAPVELTPSFSFGPSLSLGGRFSHYTDLGYCILLSGGISTVQITPQSSNNQISEAKGYSAATLLTGLVININSYSQVGVLVGCDWLSKSDYRSTNWDYNGNVWLSLGLGFNIYSPNSSSDSGEQDKKQ